MHVQINFKKKMIKFNIKLKLPKHMSIITTTNKYDFFILKEKIF